LPPFLRISAPASLARLLLLTTIACCSTVGGRRCFVAQPSGNAACTAGVEAALGAAPAGFDVLHPASTSTAASASAPACRARRAASVVQARWWRDMDFTVNDAPDWSVRTFIFGKFTKVRSRANPR